MFKVKKFLPVIILSIAVILLAGCGGTNTEQADTSGDDSVSAPAAEEIKIGKVDFAAHGTKAFTVAVAAVQGDKIVDAYIDEYQFMPITEVTGVPNSDSDFGQNYKEPDKSVLASKKTNNEYYADNMKTKAGSTQDWAISIKAVEDFAVGKTIAELEEYIGSKTEDSEPADVVSGSTLQDNYGYLSSILAAAKAAK